MALVDKKTREKREGIVNSIGAAIMIPGLCAVPLFGIPVALFFYLSNMLRSLTRSSTFWIEIPVLLIGMVLYFGMYWYFVVELDEDDLFNMPIFWIIEYVISLACFLFLKLRKLDPAGL